MVMSLTPREADLLNFIKANLSATGHIPTFQEMVDALSLKSKAGVHRLLVALEERGRIRRLKGRARAIEILDKEPLNTRDAVRALNEAAYAAAKLAGKTQHPAAEALHRIALDTDAVMDGVAQ